MPGCDTMLIRGNGKHFRMSNALRDKAKRQAVKDEQASKYTFGLSLLATIAASGFLFIKMPQKHLFPDTPDGLKDYEAQLMHYNHKRSCIIVALDDRKHEYIEDHSGIKVFERGDERYSSGNKRKKKYHRPKGTPAPAKAA